MQTAIEFESGEMVKSLRMKIGVSPLRMGEILGVSAETVRRWEKGEAKPQAAHQANLAAIHSVVSSLRNPSDELVACGLVQKLANARKLDLRHSNVAGELDLSEDPRIPGWWFDLQTEFHSQNWEGVLRWMRYFKDDIYKLPSPAREAAINWKATALLRLGHCEEAENELKRGLADCQSDIVRNWLENNCAVALMGRKKYDEADSAFESIARTAAVDTPLYNRLCIASLQRHMVRCRVLCSDLLAFHGGKISAKSPRAKSLKTDPDVAWLRETELFSEFFPGLLKKARSPMTSVARILILMALSTVFLASPACARETIGNKKADVASTQ